MQRTRALTFAFVAGWLGISLGDVPYVVVGILTAAFDTEQFDPQPDVWVPFQIDPQRVDGGNLFSVTGRLTRGISMAPGLPRDTVVRGD